MEENKIATETTTTDTIIEPTTVNTPEIATDDPLAGLSKEQIKEKLAEMRSVDIRTVDPDTLVDIKDVHINKDLPPYERVRDYIRQVKNPYCYKSHGVIVKLNFTGTATMEELLARCVSMY